MSTANGEAYLCKADISTGLYFDWEAREYKQANFIKQEMIIKVVDDNQCNEFLMKEQRENGYIKKLDREANSYGNSYKCLRKTKLGEKENTYGDICYHRVSQNNYRCDYEPRWLNNSYQFSADGGIYLGFYAPFDTTPVSADEALLPEPSMSNIDAGLEVRSNKDSLRIEAGKCSRID